MAGCTSRFIFLIALPSCVTAFSLFWFLRRRKQSPAVTGNCCEVSENHSKLVFPVVCSMDLCSRQLSSVHPNGSANMQLKEDSVSTSEQSSSSTINSKAAVDVGKSKVHVNGTTCSSSSAAEEDKSFIEYDNTDAGSVKTGKQTKMNGCHAENHELTRRLESLQLESPDETAESGISLSNGLSNRSSESFDPISPAEEANYAQSHDSLQNGSCSSEDGLNSGLSSASPENIEVDIPTIQSPDSGLSAVSQDSGATSPLSNPSVEDTGADENSHLVDDNSTHTDFNENELPGPSLEATSAVPLFDNPLMPQYHEFDIPQELCGLLIGRNGRYVKYIKEQTNADIFIRQNPYSSYMKTCSVSGTPTEINQALELIRERFPAEKYPNLSLACSTSLLQRDFALPVTMKLTLPDSITFDVIVSSVVSAGHFFVHQPTHPTYHTLSYLSNSMSNLYNSEEAPSLYHFNTGFIVAVPLEGGWYRAEIVSLNEEARKACVKLLDFGGYVEISMDALRQLSYQFMVFPFQAAECLMGSITYPEGESQFSEEAKNAFEELSQGQIVQGYIVGYDETGIPFVHLYKVQGASSLFINAELVSRGLARWVEEGEIAE